MNTATTTATTARLRSTGRRPAMNLETVEALLVAYFGEDQPGVAELAQRFEVTQATVRKYLRLALGGLPRGRAANLPREARNIQHLLNGIPTEALLGEGRIELLRRHRAAGASMTALAAEFGISRDRVAKLVREPSAPADVAQASPESDSSEG